MDNDNELPNNGYFTRKSIKCYRICMIDSTLIDIFTVFNKKINVVLRFGAKNILFFRLLDKLYRGG
jgi:hypothetical protein